MTRRNHISIVLLLSLGTTLLFGVLPALLAHGFAAAGGFAMFILRDIETGFIHVQALFTRDVALDLKR